MKENSENKPFLFNPFPKHIIDWIFGQRCILTILFHWSCQISDLSHIETEIAICQIGIMMLRDHAHPYIQSTTVLCDTQLESQFLCMCIYTTIQQSTSHVQSLHEMV